MCCCCCCCGCCSCCRLLITLWIQSDHMNVASVGFTPPESKEMAYVNVPRDIDILTTIPQIAHRSTAPAPCPPFCTGGVGASNVASPRDAAEGQRASDREMMDELPSPYAIAPWGVETTDPMFPTYRNLSENSSSSSQSNSSISQALASSHPDHR